jgi:hypothetical protein
MDPSVQFPEFALKVCVIVLPCHAVRAGRRSRLRMKNAGMRRSIVRSWKSAVNRSFFRCLAAIRTRSSAGDTLSRFGARFWLPFSLASVLRSIAFAADRPVLFGDFLATMMESDFSPPCIIGFGSLPSRCGPVGFTACGRTRDLSGSDAFPSDVMWSSTPAE